LAALFTCNRIIHLEAMGVISNMGTVALCASIDIVITLLPIISGRMNYSVLYGKRLQAGSDTTQNSSV
jgi:hypothetical protein